MKKQFTTKVRHLGLKLTAVVFALLLFASGEGRGQTNYLNDDFEDNNITGWTESTTSHWGASATGKITGSYSLKHTFVTATAATDQISYTLSSLNLSSATTTFKFKVKHGILSSANNNWGVFIISNDAATQMKPTGTADGYVVGVNYTGSDDLVKLWRIDNGVATSVISSTINWETNANLGTAGIGSIEVTRSTTGGFILKIDSNNDGTFDYTSSETTETTYTAADNFGVYFKYSSTGDQLFWIDDIIISQPSASSNDQTSKVEAPTTQISAGDIASTATTSGSAIDVFKFKISDLATADALATKVTQVKIKKSSGTADWTDHIAGAELWDGASQITTGTVVITDADITFPITSGNLDIASGSNKEITLKIWLKTTNIVDNATMVFTVSQTSHGFTADATGSGFATDFGSSVTGNTMTVRVAATKLLFTTAPSTTACPNTNLTTPPVVKATDANGMTDADFSGAVNLTNSGSIGMTGYQVASAIAGVATFTNLQFTTVGNVTLSTSNSSGLTEAPATASIAISVSNITSPAATNGNAQSIITWTNPSSCYDEIMIVAKAGSAVTATPSGDGTAYTANLAYSSGNEFDGGYVVYKGTTSSQTITGLTNGTTYHFTLFTRKGSIWSNGATTTATPAFASSASDYFRSKAVGNWNATSTWESSTDGLTNWINATLTPTSSANTITILNGHTVTVTASVSVDQVTVNTGGKIIINSSQTLTIANGAETYDMTVNGTIENAGTITSTGAVKFESGSYYKHTRNGGSCIVATWDASSTCEISGITSTTLSNLSQSFGSFVWNCTGQSAWIDAALTSSFSVAGNFTINSTGGGSVGINMTTASTNRTYNISGDLNINGGKLTLVSNNTAIITLNIGGNLALSASSLNQLDFGYGNNNPTGNYRGIINLSGNLSVGTGSTLTCTDNGTNDDYGNIVFEKQGSQTFTNNGTISWIDFDIDNGSTLVLNTNLDLGSGQTASKYNGLNVQSGGTLDFNGYNLTDNSTGEGTFEVINGGTLLISSANGITTDGSAGNVLLGYPTYNTGANYTYKGIVSQVSGNGLPATVNNLTIDNAAGVTLSNAALTVNGTLLINSGKVLEVGVDKQLTVSGTLTNNAGTSGLVLKSNASGTGSLIHSTSGVNATVERYMADNGSVSAPFWQWHFLSSPVSNQKIVGNFINFSGLPAVGDANVDFYRFDPTNATTPWVNIKQGAPNAGQLNTSFGTPSNDPEFVVGTGYLVSYNYASSTKSFSGTLNSSEVSPALITGTNKANLIGNPYTSAIDWDVIDKTNLANGYYYIYNDAIDDFEYYLDVNTKTASVNGKIPAMQAFYVVNNSKTSINLPLIARVHNTQAYLKSSNTVNSLNMIISNGTKSDETKVLVNSNASNGLDWYDATKMFSFDANKPQIYSIVGNTNKVAFNSIPSITTNTTVPVGIYVPANGNYSISADGLANFSMCTSVVLEDLKTNTTQNLLQNPVYNFTAATNDNANRFVLHFATAVGVNEIGNSNGSIYAYDNNIYINAGEQIKQINVYNTLGQLVKTLNNVNGLQKINMNGNATGYYIVKVVSDKNVYSEKVFVK